MFEVFKRYLWDKMEEVSKTGEQIGVWQRDGNSLDMQVPPPHRWRLNITFTPNFYGGIERGRAKERSAYTKQHKSSDSVLWIWDYILECSCFSVWLLWVFVCVIDLERWVGILVFIEEIAYISNSNEKTVGMFAFSTLNGMVCAHVDVKWILTYVLCTKWTALFSCNRPSFPSLPSLPWPWNVQTVQVDSHENNKCKICWDIPARGEYWHYFVL